MPAFTPGARLHDRYLLERLVGTGGMAQVWLARDLVLDRQVAVKTLTGQAAAEPSLRAGARREAQAAAQLAHPHIMAVHDYAELVESDGTVTPYLVMELLRGETLADRLERGPIPWPQAAAIGRQIAAALAAAHAQGVVHQDIKPANIMLTPSGVKVLDFGIARMTGHRESSGWVIGTPAYSPPERLRQAPPEPAADVYGLGVILFEMATGRRPWQIETWEDLQRQRFAPPRIDMPAADLIRAALDPSPQRRPSAAAFARALDGPTPTLMTPVDAAAAAVPVSYPTQRYEPPPPPQKWGRSPGLIAVTALVVLIVLIGAAYLVSGLLEPDEGTATTGPSPSSGPLPTSAAAAAPSPSAVPTSVPALLSLLRRTVENGIDTGGVSRDKAREMLKLVQELTKRWNNREKDFVEKAEDLRKKIWDHADDGDIEPELKQDLDDLLDQIIEAASSR